VHFRNKKSAVSPCSVVGCAWGTPGASGAGVVARAVRGFAGGEVVVFANVRATVEELAGEAGEHRARADGCLLPRGVLGC